jgi:hypothetical protein
MFGDPRSDPVLTRVWAALSEDYDEGLERAVLYGSGARGGHRPLPIATLPFSSRFGTLGEEFRRIGGQMLGLSGQQIFDRPLKRSRVVISHHRRFSRSLRDFSVVRGAPSVDCIVASPNRS